MTIRSRQTFEQLVTLPDLAIPLAEAALLLACEEYPQLSLTPYLQFLDQAAERTRGIVPPRATPEDTIGALNEVLFNHYGFSGNTSDYYDPRNSFLNDVIERRTGIPIALSSIYMAVADRLDFAVEGVGVPGHFVVRHRSRGLEIFLDPFNAGTRLTRDDLLQLAQGGEAEEHDADSWLRRSTHRQILVRMLNNLRLIYLGTQAFDKALAMMDLMLIAEPSNAELYRHRGLIRIELGQFAGAARDLRSYLRQQSGDGAEMRDAAHKLANLQAMLN